MKRLLTLALFAVLLLPAVAQELTVATYNIRNANKGDAERGNGWERRCPWAVSYTHLTLPTNSRV